MCVLLCVCVCVCVCVLFVVPTRDAARGAAGYTAKGAGDLGVLYI